MNVTKVEALFLYKLLILWRSSTGNEADIEKDEATIESLWDKIESYLTRSTTLECDECEEDEEYDECESESNEENTDDADHDDDDELSDFVVDKKDVVEEECDDLKVSIFDLNDLSTLAAKVVFSTTDFSNVKVSISFSTETDGTSKMTMNVGDYFIEDVVSITRKSKGLIVEEKVDDDIETHEFSVMKFPSDWVAVLPVNKKMIVDYSTNF